MSMLEWWHNEASPTLPGYLASLALALACSRRVPALRPVAACFAAWSLLDAVTGPLWLRAGVLVAWPGAALVAGAWGLQTERGPIDLLPRRKRRKFLRRHDARGAIDAIEGERARNGQPIGHEEGAGVATNIRTCLASEDREVIEGGIAYGHPPSVAIALAAVYLIAGGAAALPYALGHLAPYHALLPLSRALAVTLCALAAVLRPLPRTWAARACVAPAVGLACGVVAGVWTLLPAGMGAVREAWGRLAGAETWATLVVTAGCVVAAWWEARGR